MYTKMSWPAQIYSIPCTRNPFHAHKSHSMYTKPFHAHATHSMHTQSIPCTRNPFHAHMHTQPILCTQKPFHVHKRHSMHTKAIPCTNHIPYIHVRTTYVYTQKPFHVHKKPFQTHSMNRSLSMRMAHVLIGPEVNEHPSTLVHSVGASYVQTRHKPIQA